MTTKLLPSPPDSVRVDTVVVAVEFVLRPTFPTAVADGGKVQFCTFIVLSNGRTTQATNNAGLLFRPEQERAAIRARCDELYSRWLTERSV